VDVTIPRPRSRDSIIEHPHYYKIRNHVIHFLVRHAKHAGEAVGSEACEEGQAPMVVRF
jgi:nitrate/nitrite transport system ATP-binding protein